MITRLKHSYWGLAVGVVAISFSPLAVKLVSFTPSVSAFYRSLYAAVFFLLIALWRGRGVPAHGSGWLPLSLLAGVFLGADLVLWHKSIMYLGAGPATFLGNSQIIFVTLFAAVVYREKIPALFYGSVALTMTGLFLLLPEKTVDVSRLTGYGMGLAVGFTYAGMLISLRYAKSRSRGCYPEILSLCACFFASAATIALYTVPVEKSSLFAADARSHVIMAATAFLCQTFGWYLINTNITRIPAHRGSFMLMLQPVLATAWGALFFLEPFDALQFLGVAMAIAGIALYQFRSGSARTEPVDLPTEQVDRTV